jgi:predicted dehydrogenase
MCRKRGRIVLTGVTGLQLSRDDFYKKELSFQVSCSYGPGRYDPAYEQNGQDYPQAYVRWTAQRNFEAVLQLMAEDRLRVDSLITHRFSFESVNEAYRLLGTDEKYLGILLEYAEKDSRYLRQQTLEVVRSEDGRHSGKLAEDRENIGVIGAGSYATKVLLPALEQAGAHMASIGSNTGASAQYAAKKFGIAAATTDTDVILSDPSVNAVVVATRHDSHARYVIAALRVGKHVFVEKPLALRMEDVDEIEHLCAAGKATLVVGFNRRFAPHAQKMRQLLAGVSGPKCVLITVNAGAVPREHWTQDERLGGGRLIGEGCHFLDLARFMIGRKIVDARWSKISDDTATLLVDFEDKSQANIHYLSNGHRSFPKERVQVFADGKILELDNWRKLKGYGWRGFKALNLWRQDKGNAACIRSWVAALRNGGRSPIPFDEIMEVSRWALLSVKGDQVSTSVIQRDNAHQ